jgi:hypothetical protein
MPLMDAENCSRNSHVSLRLSVDARSSIESFCVYGLLASTTRNPT